MTNRKNNQPGDAVAVVSNHPLTNGVPVRADILARALAPAVPAIHISTENTKLGCIPSVNLPPVVTCRKNAPCQHLCYACKGRQSFAGVKVSFLRNLRAWNETPERYEAAVVAAATGARYFRWHSAGDIPSRSYLEMIFRVARAVPTCKFMVFSKQFEIINGYLDGHAVPENLTIILSSWGPCFIPPNPHNLPTANVELFPGCPVPAGAIRCPGKCTACTASGKSCWHLKPGEAVVFPKH